MPSVERWYVLSSVVRRYISFIVSGTSMNYISLYHQWYGGIYLFHASSGTLLCVTVSGSSMNHFLLYHQWYGGIYLFMPSLERWYVLSSVVRRYISSSVVRWSDFC